MQLVFTIVTNIVDNDSNCCTLKPQSSPVKLPSPQQLPPDCLWSSSAVEASNDGGQ